MALYCLSLYQFLDDVFEAMTSQLVAQNSVIRKILFQRTNQKKSRPKVLVAASKCTLRSWVDARHIAAVRVKLLLKLF